MLVKSLSFYIVWIMFWLPAPAVLGRSSVFVFITRKSYPSRLLLFCERGPVLRTNSLPPNDLIHCLRKSPLKAGKERSDKHVEPERVEPLCDRRSRNRLVLRPVVANLLESLWIISDDPVNLFLDAPSHHVFVINSPDENLPTCVFHVSDKI